MNAPPKLIFPTYDDDTFKTIPLPPVHNITCNQYESTDAVDTGHKSDADNELSDAEQFLSDDDISSYHISSYHTSLFTLEFLE